MRIVGGLLLCAAAGIWLNNTRLLGPRLEAHDLSFLAHRGVHQTYAGVRLDRDTCTANPIHPLTHSFIENTLPSMEAAFAAGADIKEMADINPIQQIRENRMRSWQKLSKIHLPIIAAVQGLALGGGLELAGRPAGQGSTGVGSQGGWVWLIAMLKPIRAFADCAVPLPLPLPNHPTG